MIYKKSMFKTAPLFSTVSLQNTTARPVLKWAGGKGQLLEQIINYLPKELKTGQITRYIEPFIGGGALFFFIAQNYAVRELYISDSNAELIVLYTTIQQRPKDLIRILGDIEKNYHALTAEKQKEFFYEIREKYNQEQPTFNFGDFFAQWINRAAQIIFLNKTCFNGLFRVNSKGGFNVPHGDYKNPRICDTDNLSAVSEILKRTVIKYADFTECESFIDENAFVYFDPPYRPLSKTASFNAYSKANFGDPEQERLAKFYRLLDRRGTKLMLSNSDPKNTEITNEFFDELYNGFDIKRVKASRNINSNSAKRGQITELLITNY
jgi:DNA adenine methylase